MEVRDICYTGDFHLRFKTPRSRRDESYFETQRGKVEQILSRCAEWGVDVLVQPGDFFDSADSSLYLIQIYVALFKEWGVPILTVPGQHDLKFHSRRVDNIPLAVLQSAGVVKVLSPDEWLKMGGVEFLGIGYNDSLEETLDRMLKGRKSRKRVVVIHKMVVEEGPQWKGQEDFVVGRDLLRRYPGVDVFVCGDNHRSFTCRMGDRWIINCGSLMRANIDQVDHEPHVYMHNLGEDQVSKLPLEVRPVREVLDVEKAEEEKEQNEELEAFIRGISDVELDLNFDFTASVRTAMKNLSDGVKEVLEEVLDGTEEGGV